MRKNRQRSRLAELLTTSPRRRNLAFLRFQQHFPAIHFKITFPKFSPHLHEFFRHLLADITTFHAICRKVIQLLVVPQLPISPDQRRILVSKVLVQKLMLLTTLAFERWHKADTAGRPNCGSLAFFGTPVIILWIFNTCQLAQCRVYIHQMTTLPIKCPWNGNPFWPVSNHGSRNATLVLGLFQPFKWCIAGPGP